MSLSFRNSVRGHSRTLAQASVTSPSSRFIERDDLAVRSRS